MFDVKSLHGVGIRLLVVNVPDRMTADIVISEVKPDVELLIGLESEEVTLLSKRT